MKQELTLEYLYSKIPKTICKKKCSACCSPVMLLPEEAINLGIEGATSTGQNKDLKCSLLKDNKCSKYINRPFICRIFGSMQGGPYSCEWTKNSTLTLKESTNLLKLYFVLIIHEPNAEKIFDEMQKSVDHDKLYKNDLPFPKGKLIYNSQKYFEGLALEAIEFIKKIEYKKT